MRKFLQILTFSLICAAPSVGSAAPKDTPRDHSRTPGSKARQLLLKLALQKSMSRTLVAELNQNKKLYGSMNPQQRRDLRDKVLAYKRLDPDRKVDIITAAQEWFQLTDQQKAEYRKRQKWLRRLIPLLGAEQRDRLSKLTPQARARRLLELKAELLDKPSAATQPATAPATTKP